MSMAGVVSFPGGTLCAADTRGTFTSSAGVRDTQDFGFKIRRVHDGWSGITGSIGTALLALRQTERLGVTRTEEALRLAVEEAKTMGEVNPGMRLCTIGDDGHIRIAVDGLGPGRSYEEIPARPGAFEFCWQPPARMAAEDEAQLQPIFEERMRVAASIDDIVRGVAATFHFAYEHSDGSISDELEVGTTLGGQLGYLRALNTELLATTGGVGLSAPPVLPPWPELNVERRMFKWMGAW